MTRPVTREAIAENIRVLLARRRVAQTVIADHLGLSQASISERLSGRTNIRVEELTAIAKLLEVPLEQLLATEPQEASA